MMNASPHLRPPLLANAIFSGSTGLLLALASPVAASWLGPQMRQVYLLLGIGLLLFCLMLGLVAVRPDPLVVLGITGADLGWVAGTTGAVLWRHDFTPSGIAWVLGTNAVVTAFAWWQLRSIRKAFRAAEGLPDEYQVCIAVDAPVAAAAFWRILADLGAIQKYMPALRSSSLVGGGKSGAGCVRTCEDVKGRVWSEKCEEWEEGKSFNVVFLAEAPGFPLPFSKMRGGWRVIPQTTGCQVQVWWRVVPRRPWMAALLLPLMATGARRSFADVVARMALAAQGVSVASSLRPSLPRLHVMAC